MGLILVAIGVIAIGVLCHIIGESSYGILYEILCPIFCIIGGAGLFILVLVFSINFLSRQSDINSYEVDSLLIEMSYTNPNATVADRSLALEKAMSYNKQILNARTYKNNFWMGIFYNPLFADLPTFDINRIKAANPAFTIHQ